MMVLVAASGYDIVWTLDWHYRQQVRLIAERNQLLSAIRFPRPREIKTPSRKDTILLSNNTSRRWNLRSIRKTTTPSYGLRRWGVVRQPTRRILHSAAGGAIL